MRISDKHYIIAFMALCIISSFILDDWVIGALGILGFITGVVLRKMFS